MMETVWIVYEWDGDDEEPQRNAQRAFATELEARTWLAEEVARLGYIRDSGFDIESVPFGRPA